MVVRVIVIVADVLVPDGPWLIAPRAAHRVSRRDRDGGVDAVDVLMKIDPGFDGSSHRTARGDFLQPLELRLGHTAGEGDRDLEPAWRGVVVVIDVNRDISE